LAARTDGARQFAARPSGFKCDAYANIIQSYCDAPDPFCSNGNSSETHSTYAKVYGQQAMLFVKGKVDGLGYVISISACRFLGRRTDTPSSSNSASSSQATSNGDQQNAGASYRAGALLSLVFLFGASLIIGGVLV
jgi:hypothetical protein